MAAAAAAAAAIAAQQYRYRHAFESLIVECGSADDPAGVGMPAWPDGKQTFYTRQMRSMNGDLRVEVWRFLEPGHVLGSADHQINGGHIIVKPRWSVPDGVPLAACYAKFGAAITLHDAPKGSYVIDVE